MELCVAPVVRDPLCRCAVALDRYEDFVAVETGGTDTLVGVLRWYHDIVGEFSIFLLAAEDLDGLIDAREAFAALGGVLEIGRC